MNISKKPEFSSKMKSKIDIAENAVINQSIVIIFLMKFVGLLPFSREGTQLVFKLHDTVCIYSFAFYLMIMFYVTKRIKSSIGDIVDESCDFNCQTFEIIIIILSLQIVLIPVTFWKQMNHITEYFVLWHQFQETFKYYSKRQLTIGKESRVKKLIFLLFLISAFLSLSITVLFYNLDFNTDIFLTYFLICFYTNICICFWIIQCDFVQEEAQNIQIFFQQLAESSRNSSVNIISIYFELWSGLNGILKSLTRSLSGLISLLCFCTFLSSLISSYCLVSQIFSTDAEFNMKLATLNLILSVWTLGVVYLLNDSSFNVFTQVDFRNWIVTVNLNKLNEKLYDQVLELISYFENEIPKVSMFGFEFLSREFLVTLSSTLITYIIIILQFRSPSAHTHTSTAHCTNTTT